MKKNYISSHFFPPCSGCKEALGQIYKSISVNLKILINLKVSLIHSVGNFMLSFHFISSVALILILFCFCKKYILVNCLRFFMI